MKNRTVLLEAKAILQEKLRRPENESSVSRRSIRPSLAVFAYLLLVAVFSGRLPVFAQDKSNTDRLVQDNTRFALDLYGKLRTGQDNLVFSPYSISSLLALIYGGARERTAEQMAKVMHLSLGNELHATYAEMQRMLSAAQQKGRIELYIANSLWPQSSYPFLDAYLGLAKRYYKSEIISLDYLKDPEAARLTINTWVEGKTNKRIQNMLPKRTIRKTTTLALVNAIYFKGEWLTKFNKADTVTGPFHLNSSRTSSVPMMHQENRFNLLEDEIAQVLEMPYAGNELSMLIALPTRIDGLQNLEQILTVDRLKKWNSMAAAYTVAVFLPRFTLASGLLDLKEVLQDVGMKDAFDVNKADFSGMDGNLNGLYLQFFLHKAFLDVNEDGAEAAAATAAGCFPSGVEVLTDGGLRTIETVEAGTKVASYDPTNGKWVSGLVLRREAFLYEGDMVTIQLDTASMRATGNQPFLVLRGEGLASRPLPKDVSEAEPDGTGHGRWVEARDLRKGDALLNKDGDGAVVTGLSTRQERTRVYFLEVKRYHNSAVHRLGVLAHNAKKGLAPAFRADHPFLFLIRHNPTGSILFMGRVSNPQ